MKKRILSLLLALALCMSLFACSADNADDNAANPPENNTETQQPVEPADTDDSEEEDSYYPVTITNYNYSGEPVEYTYEKAPEKVIAVYQGSIETMIAWKTTCLPPTAWTTRSRTSGRPGLRR